MMTFLLLAALLQDPLPTEKDAEAAVHKLREDCAKSPIEGKIAALQEALQTEHEKVIKAVGELLVTEADPVRIAGAAALAAVDHPASAEALAAALLPNLRREDVFPAILKAIVELGWQSPAARLHDLLSRVGDADVRAVLPGVLATLGQLGSAASIDPVIDLLVKVENGGRRNAWQNEGPMRRNGEDALRAISGQQFRQVGDWQNWWRANQEILRAKVRRTYWLKKTQDRLEVGLGEKAPGDALLVASHLSGAPLIGAQAPRKKKKGK